MLRYANALFYYYRWQCSYGDKDYRFAKDLVLDKSNKPKTGQGSRLARHEGGPSRKRGCLAKFSIKQFYLWPLVAQITYYQVSHTDKYDLPCHEIADSTSVKEKAQQKPWISQDMKLWIEQELAQTLKPQQILA